MKNINVIHFSLVLFVLVFLITIVDITSDFKGMGELNRHIMVEALLAFLSAIAFAVLFRSIRNQHKTLDKTLTNLRKTHEQLSEVESQTAKLMGEFSKIIQTQFNEWNFTESEKEVALLMLKGLSLDEIATVRNTKEKTVRQQASSCYKKANVSGRHELAAYFFEDLLL
jgi:DNA-binding NarL/FixJ family response regulator